MANRYNLSEDKLKLIRERDQKCVYCGKTMIKPKNEKDFIE